MAVTPLANYICEQTARGFGNTTQNKSSAANLRHLPQSPAGAAAAPADPGQLAAGQLAPPCNWPPPAPPPRPYSVFLAQFQTFGYVAVYALMLLARRQ